jgi:hypothetical protein
MLPPVPAVGVPPWSEGRIAMTTTAARMMMNIRIIKTRGRMDPSIKGVAYLPGILMTGRQQGNDNVLIF